MKEQTPAAQSDRYFVVGNRVRHAYAGCGTVIKASHRGNRGEVNTAVVRVRWDDGRSGEVYVRDLKHDRG